MAALAAKIDRSFPRLSTVRGNEHRDENRKGNGKAADGSAEGVWLVSEAESAPRSALHGRERADRTRNDRICSTVAVRFAVT